MRVDGKVVAGGAATRAATREQEFAKKRQLFLAEQGYAYEIIGAHDLHGDASIDAGVSV